MTREYRLAGYTMRLHALRMTAATGLPAIGPQAPSIAMP
jgi:hypothetical protein